MVATAAALPSGAVLASAKKRAAAKAKKKTTVVVKKKSASPRVQKVHPRTAELVDSAIAALGDRSGSTLADIKKYISANYGVDAEKLTPLIKKALATKAVGSPGGFKIDAKPAASVTPKKRAAAKKPAKKSPAKKKASPKKKVGRKSLGGKSPKPKSAKKKAPKKKPAKKTAKK